MRNKDLIKKLSMFDPDAIVTYLPWGQEYAISLESIEPDEAIKTSLGDFDVLSSYKNLTEMEDYYQSSDSDPLAFVSLIVLS